MAEQQTWYGAVEVIEPHVVRILTPRGAGTGFLVACSPKGDLIALATAAHVIEHAHSWEDPIRIEHTKTGQAVLLKTEDRAVFIEAGQDTAAIVVSADKLPFPKEALPLAPEKKHLKVGNDIGWLGFPAISSTNLCFFGGRISAWISGAYLVDGVAINGVSGGPAFHLTAAGPVVIGVVSAYVPNRATGESLPGLAVVRDVTQYHEIVKEFKSLAEAKKEETPPAPNPPAAEEPKGELPTKARHLRSD